MGNTSSQPEAPSERDEIGGGNDSDSPVPASRRDGMTTDGDDTDAREIPSSAPVWSSAIKSEYGDSLLRNFTQPTRQKKRKSHRTGPAVTSTPAALQVILEVTDAQNKRETAGESQEQDMARSLQGDEPHDGNASTPVVGRPDASVGTEHLTASSSKKKKKKGDKKRKKSLGTQEHGGPEDVPEDDLPATLAEQSEAEVETPSKKKKKKRKKNRRSITEPSQASPTSRPQPDSAPAHAFKSTDLADGDDEHFIPSSLALPSKRKWREGDGEPQPTHKRRALSVDADSQEVVEDSFPHEVEELAESAMEDLKAEQLSAEMTKTIHEIITDEARRIYPPQQNSSLLDPKDIKAEPGADVEDESGDQSEGDRLDTLLTPAAYGSPTKLEKNLGEVPGWNRDATDSGADREDSGLEQDAQPRDNPWDAGDDDLPLEDVKRSPTDDEAEEESGDEAVKDEGVQVGQDVNHKDFSSDEETKPEIGHEDISSDEEEVTSGAKSMQSLSFDDIEDDESDHERVTRHRQAFDDIQDEIEPPHNLESLQETNEALGVEEAQGNAMDVDEDSAGAMSTEQEAQRAGDRAGSPFFSSSDDESIPAKRPASPVPNRRSSDADVPASNVSTNGNRVVEAASNESNEENLFENGSDGINSEEAISDKTRDGDQDEEAAEGDVPEASSQQIQALAGNLMPEEDAAVHDNADTHGDSESVPDDDAVDKSVNDQPAPESSPRSPTVKKTPLSDKRRPKLSFIDRPEASSTLPQSSDGPSRGTPAKATPSSSASRKTGSARGSSTRKGRSKLSSSMRAEDGTPTSTQAKTPRATRTPGTPATKDGFNMGPWTNDETNALTKAVDDFMDRHALTKFELAELVQSEPSRSNPLQMEILMVATDATPTRKRRQVKEKLRTLYHNHTAMGKWSPEQEEEFREMYEIYGPQWAKIGQLINRDPKYVRDYWRHRYVCDGKLKIGPWTEEEEERLRDAILDAVRKIRQAREQDPNKQNAPKRDDFDLVDWQQISQAMDRTRNRAQCLWKFKDLRDKGEFSTDLRSTPAGSAAVDVSALLAMAREDLQNMPAEDQYRFVQSLSEARADRDGQIPWHHLVDDEFRKKWKRPTRKLLWHRLRKALPDCHEHSVAENARRLLGIYDARGEFPMARGFIDDREEEKIIGHHKPGERKWVLPKETDGARRMRRRRSRSRSRSTDRSARSTASRELDGIHEPESSDDETIPAKRSETNTPMKWKTVNRRSSGREMATRGRSRAPVPTTSSRGDRRVLSKEFVSESSPSEEGAPDKASVAESDAEQAAEAAPKPSRRAAPREAGSDNESADLDIDIDSLNRSLRSRSADEEVEDSEPESGRRPSGSPDLGVAPDDYSSVPAAAVGKLKRARNETPSDIDVSQFKKQRKKRKVAERAPFVRPSSTGADYGVSSDVEADANGVGGPSGDEAES